MNLNDPMTALAKKIVADARAQAERNGLLLESVIETLFDGYQDALWEATQKEAYRVVGTVKDEDKN